MWPRSEQVNKAAKAKVKRRAIAKGFAGMAGGCGSSRAGVVLNGDGMIK